MFPAPWRPRFRSQPTKPYTHSIALLETHAARPYKLPLAVLASLHVRYKWTHEECFSHLWRQSCRRYRGNATAKRRDVARDVRSYARGIPPHPLRKELPHLLLLEPNPACSRAALAFVACLL